MSVKELYFSCVLGLASEELFIAIHDKGITLLADREGLIAKVTDVRAGVPQSPFVDTPEDNLPALLQGDYLTSD